MDFHFENIGDFLVALELPPKFADNRFLCGRSSWVCSDRQPAGVEACKQLVTQPFPVGVARVLKASSELQPPTPRNRRRKPVRADAGDELDLDRVWQGELDRAWRTCRREVSTGPSRVLIEANIAASCNVNAEAMAWRGAAALALADQLSLAGYMVEIVATVAVTLYNASSDPYNLELCVLQAGDPIDLNLLASLIASPMLFRALVHQHMYLVSETELGVGASHVRPTNLKPRHGIDYVAAMPNGDAVRDEYTAREWVEGHLAALQCDSI